MTGFSVWFERLAPLLLGAASLCALLFWRTSIAQHFTSGGWQPGNLYGAVFNWASIQSGFVFGIYGFIATKKDGFVGAIANRSSFRELLAYTRRAYATGFALTFVSLPMLVAAPALNDASSMTFVVVCVWFSCFIWTFCAFLRVAFIFGIIVATPDKADRIIG